jgi:hypothetical protein
MKNLNYQKLPEINDNVENKTNFITNKTAIIFRKYFLNFPDFFDWLPSKLERHCGDVLVSVHTQKIGFDINQYTEDPILYSEMFPNKIMEVKHELLSTFINYLHTYCPEKDPLWSIAGLDISAFPEMAPPPIPFVCKQKGCTTMNIWFGPKGRVWNLHRDDTPVFIGLITGRREVIIASPESSKNLYIHENNNELSKVGDLTKVKLEDFPNLSEVEFLTGYLDPGDLLFIPTNWWHQVSYLEDSLSINYWDG